APVAPEIARHMVVAGDTVADIAAAYGLDVASVLSANGLGPSSLIFPGESIVLPLTGDLAPPSAVAVQTTPEAGAPRPGPASEAPPAPGDSHVVAEGDTLSAIAEAYGVTVAELDAAKALGGGTGTQPGAGL